MLLGGCASGEPQDATQAASGPCAFLPEERAANILGGDVKRTSWTDVFEATEGEVAPEARARFDAADKQMCWYGRSRAKEFVGVQFDRGLMTKEEFSGAWGDRAEILNEPGVVSAYAESTGDNEGESDNHASLTVMLNEDGDTVSLQVSGKAITKAEMLAAGREMAEDY